MPSTNPPARPEPLLARHKVAGFDCGSAPLNTFLVRHALANHQSGSARIFVCLDGPQVAAYYSLAAGEILHAASPERLRKGQASHPIPVVLLARLAVDLKWQGHKLGSALLKDAILRVINASESIGVRALLVHAKDEKAVAFYEQFGFESLPEYPLHLVLLLKDAKRQLE